MQSPSTYTGKCSYHPHSDINTSHNLRNSVIYTELSSASLSIAFPDTRITEFNYNSTIPDLHYTKVYLPNTTLIGYKNGLLFTTEGHAYACVHFDPSDSCIFDLAGLNTLDPKSHVLHVNNAEVTRPSATTTSMTNPFTSSNNTAQSITMDPQPTTTGSPYDLSPPSSTSQHVTTISSVSCLFMLLDPTTSYHVTTAQPVSQLDEKETLTILAFLLWERRAMLEHLNTFGSAPTNNHIATDEKNTDEYTKVEWLFLNQVLGYCQRKKELQKRISIPEKLCQGEFLEGLGMEGQVSLCLPILESLFVHASRTWPNFLFKMFARKDPRLFFYDEHNYLQLPNPETSSEDDMLLLEHDSTASSDIDWTYPLTPPPLPSLEVPQPTIQPLSNIPEEPELMPLKLPLRQFEDLQVNSDNRWGERDELAEDPNSNIFADVEMQIVDTPTHLTSVATPSVTVFEANSIYGEDDVPLLRLDGDHHQSPTKEDELEDEPNMLKYRKVTRPGIEPRTFWTYTRYSNQLSYLALEFNQLILYLCNCQPKDTYSTRHIQCHSLHARSTLWPWHDQISQSGNHVTDYIIQFQQNNERICRESQLAL